MEYFDYPEEVDDGSASGPSWGEVKQLLERSDDQRKQRLQQELERIEDQIGRREELYKEAIDQVRSQIDRYTGVLETLYSRPFSGGRAERDKVTEKLSELYTDLQREKRQHWQDRQSLEQERRDILRELDEVVDSRSVLDLL